MNMQVIDSTANIKVSVIVPAYQASSTITRCLEALQAQDVELPYEVIVVDDGSADNTTELAGNSCALVICHKEKSGAAAARNSGVRSARGEIICFTDADCMPKEDWIQQMLLPFDDPEIVGAKGVYRTNQTEVVARFVQIEYEDKYDLLRLQERINFIDTYSAAYRKDILLANGGFDEQVFYVEDQELSFRLASRGYQMVFQPSATVYHLHSNSVHSYLRKKFMNGYWKAQILRRFPGRAIHDSHTPQVLKVQIILLALMLLSAMGMLFTGWSGIVLAASFIGFFMTTIPFLTKAWSKDRNVTLAAPFLLGIRAAALGFGYAWGLVNRQPGIGQERTIDGFNYIVKRAMDIIGALIGTLVTLVVAPVIALAIKFDSEGPIIFKQERIGAEGKPFTLYKFRSMHANAELELANIVNFDELIEPVYKQKDDPRLTRVGRLLRRWSLDELPQFWNVLKGDMSLVGPRPEETRFVERYEAWHRRRLVIKPGLTGPMQVNGRGDLPLDTRVRLDLDYIENYSIRRDIAILLETIPAVIRGSGAH
jgi:lipopolysaccharide/colanic/teichoic acid biosynthesis glycosyltransferase/glycosyltransferase involved in cell wall biosynthesis